MTSISIRSSRRSCAAALATLVLAWNAGSAQAQGISGIVSTNGSTPDSAISTLLWSTEFRSRTAFGEAVLVGNVVSFEHRLSWFAGQLADGIVGLPLLQPELAYQVVFTVDDPLNQGYELRVSGQLRGYVHADVGSTVGAAQASVTRLRTRAFAAFEPEAIELADLDTPQMSVLAFPGQGIQGAVTNTIGASQVGHWTGTRSFMLSVSSAPSMMSTNGNALAFAQFGRSPSLGDLGAGNDTGPGNPDMSELGHFLTVQARFIPAPIPEPATALLLLAGMGVMAFRRRRTL